MYIFLYPKSKSTTQIFDFKPSPLVATGNHCTDNFLSYPVRNNSSLSSSLMSASKWQTSAAYCSLLFI
uniref:Uncharacterized protein n=1 Tax=Romanomermis culicivorax TaxID=13658 RepID=A0A915KY63_ROMCU